MNSLQFFETRVTPWENDAKETLSELIMIGVVVRSLQTMLSRSLADQHWWHDRMDVICQWSRTRSIGMKHAANTDGFVSDRQPKSRVPRKLFMVWDQRLHCERLSKQKPNTCGTTKRVDNLARERKLATDKTDASRISRNGKAWWRVRHKPVKIAQLGSNWQLATQTGGLKQRSLEKPCMGTSGTTIATDGCCSRTVQSNELCDISMSSGQCASNELVTRDIRMNKTMFT